MSDSTVPAEEQADAVWEVVEGDCKVTSWDSECVASPNYPDASDDQASCVLKLRGTRILKLGDINHTRTTSSKNVGDEATGQAFLVEWSKIVAFFDNIDFTLSDGVLRHGMTDPVHLTEGRSSTDNTTIHWHVRDSRGTPGWTICARRFLNEGPVALQDDDDDEDDDRLIFGLHPGEVLLRTFAVVAPVIIILLCYEVRMRNFETGGSQPSKKQESAIQRQGPEIV
eukprot:CAMPEP_0194771524 /NCGR_PEP_ID=MMETSP0323_2-20130528/49456_1 /TAXON_ID=2866 ORGANISM="Crypthecodinium cohnii, Strain Seligo" /NCGR_SAMPLE_ID=MMETSP0323_2 /ASSEMBLY_ACC=CAM_ASM_000346 /LENGTH=225 /DNA_ID=CAMNT_0039705655 /DNA_START=124 /DNA_END=801 /DNA_ORIENTATION=-